MTVNRERQMRDQEVTTLNLDFETLGSAVDELQRLIEAYGRDAKICSRCEQYSESDKEYLSVMVPRLETDKEMKERIKREETSAAARLRYERRQYEALKKKFGNKT